MELDLARDILDQELLDRNGVKMGRVDGLVFIVDGDAPPRLDRFELGFVVLARRVHPRVEKWIEKLRKWSVRKVAVQLIPWSSVEEITSNHLKVSIDASDTPAFDWEHWFREKIVTKIPGGGKES